MITMSTRSGARTLLLVPVLVLAAACSERSLTDPNLSTPPRETPAPPEGTVLLKCDADVAAAEVRCAPVMPTLPDGVSGQIVIGGQDIYVRLSSSGTAYDGTQVFRTDVTLQNLTGHTLGTDGMTVDGLQVFFHQGPDVTSGSGTVTVANADGTATFLASDQPYFNYGGVLSPLEISGAREWIFHMPATVNTFSFAVYVATSMVDESAPLLGAVWTGAASTDWFASTNWRDGDMLDASADATVPPLALLAEGAAQPVLEADAAILHLRVGTGSSIDLNSHTLTVGGNLDAVGALIAGHLVLTGSDALLGGTLPAVRVTGDAQLQRATTMSGPLSVSDGSLATAGRTLTIILP